MANELMVDMHSGFLRGFLGNQPHRLGIAYTRANECDKKSKWPLKCDSMHLYGQTYNFPWLICIFVCHEENIEGP